MEPKLSFLQGAVWGKGGVLHCYCVQLQGARQLQECQNQIMGRVYIDNT